MPQSAFLSAAPSVLNISLPLQSDVGTLTHLHGPVQKSPSSKAFHYASRVHHFLLQISTAFHVLTLESSGLSLRITHSRSIPWHCVGDSQSTMYLNESESHQVVSDSLWPHGLYSPWNSSGQNTAVGSLSLLQGIFPTQGSNPGLLHCRQILYQLSHKGSPRILERVAYPFSGGSFPPRNWTGISCIAGGFFTNWAIREALYLNGWM